MSLGDGTRGGAALRGVRHDLRHQLATLRALVTATRNSAASGPAALEDLLDITLTEIGHTLDLADALPDGLGSPAAPRPGASTSGTGPCAGAVPRELCDLDGVLRAAARAGRGSGRTVDVESRGPLHVAMPRAPLARVVRNLLGNALAATSPDGRVLLRGTSAGTADPPGEESGPPPGHVRLEVHDDGPGPGPGGFSRCGGTGLAVVRSLVLPAGGWLVLGRSPWGGAVAAVTLPAAPAELPA